MPCPTRRAQGRLFRSCLPAAALVLLLAPSITPAGGSGTGTAFTYQGTLSDNGVPLSGTVSLRYSLWDADMDGTSVGTPATIEFIDTTVTDGLVTQTLDFGGAFNGDPRYLEIEVDEDGGSDAFVVLTPRVALLPVPHAMVAETALHVSSLSASDGDPAEALTVDDGGNVAIGTTGPASALHVYSSSDFGGLTLQLSDNNHHNGIRFRNSAGSYTWYIMRENIGSNLADLVFASGLNVDPSQLTERLRVGNDGTVAAAAFSGDGSAVTNVDAATLDGLDSSAYATSDHTHPSEIPITGGDYLLAGRDTVLQGSVSIGADAQTGISYGFDTLIIREDNTRILFQDASDLSGFPTEDWRLTANDNASGGDDYFAIEAATTGTTPFRVDNGAGNNAFRIEDGGGVGLGIANPEEELHVFQDDTPTIRLDQVGGFGTQRWDIGGNEVNFFVRDVTHSSRLPFKIVPSALNNALVIDANGEVAMGLAGSPPNASANLHVRSTATNAEALIIEIDSTNVLSVVDDTVNAVNVDGDFNVANGTKNFVLDHPINPASMELAHNAVEAPAHFTFYKGRVQLDGNGEGWAELPSYFEALNTGWDYQLTAIGAAMPSLHVAQEVTRNRFKIAGGVAGKAVSWQVTAQRNDPWAQDHPYQSERPKADRHQGRYYYPAGYGQERVMAIGHIVQPAESKAAESVEGALDDGR